MTAASRPLIRAQRLFTGEGGLWRTGVAAAVLLSLACQHPVSLFGRVRRKDILSALPNWKFFAPVPATHDVHLLYRTLDAERNTSDWKSLDLLHERKLTQMVWFPSRRPEKAVFDLYVDFQSASSRGFDSARQTTAYQVLVEYLRATVRTQDDSAQTVTGFQFAVVQATGYDTSDTPEMLLVSPYTPLDPREPAALTAPTQRTTRP